MAKPVSTPPPLSALPFPAQRVNGFHLPWQLAPDLGRDIILNRTRPFAADCAAMVAAMPAPPRVVGREHIPAAGPFALAANHLEGPGLWIGWPAALLTAAVHSVRPDPVPVHWLVLREMDRRRVNGIKRLVPAASWAFARVAHAWSMIALPPADDPAARAAAVRALLRRVLPAPDGEGRPVGVFPEGEDGSLSFLRAPAPGASALLALLVRRDVPVLPAAVWLQDGSLSCRFGPSLRSLQRATAAAEVMRAIAALMPARGQTGAS